MYVKRQTLYLTIKDGIFTILGTIVAGAFLIGITNYLSTIMGMVWAVVTLVISAIIYTAIYTTMTSLSDERFTQLLSAKRGFPEKYAHMNAVHNEVHDAMGVVRVPAFVSSNERKSMKQTLGILGFGSKKRLIVGQDILAIPSFVHEHLHVLLAHEAVHVKYRDTSNRAINYLLRGTGLIIGNFTVVASLIAFGWRTALMVYVVQYIWRALSTMLFSQAGKVQEKRCDLIAAELYSPAAVAAAMRAYLNLPSMVEKHKKIYGRKIKQHLFGMHPYIVDRLNYMDKWSNEFEGQNFVPPSLTATPDGATADVDLDAAIRRLAESVVNAAFGIRDRSPYGNIYSPYKVRNLR